MDAAQDLTGDGHICSLGGPTLEPVLRYLVSSSTQRINHSLSASFPAGEGVAKRFNVGNLLAILGSGVPHLERLKCSVRTS